MRRLTLFILLLAAALAFAGDNLKVNPKLDYTSDSQDGPLISGDNLKDGAVSGKPNYVLIVQEGCFNSKRQARRSVSLYEKYKEQVNFVVIDLDKKPSKAQKQLVDAYYRGYIPHVVVLDRFGHPLYSKAGEVDETAIAQYLDKALAK
jgi:hypothetical protein